MPTQIATQDALHALFHPRAVAVIGASDDTTKHGYIVLTNVRDTGFPRRHLRHQPTPERCRRHPVLSRSARRCRNRSTPRSSPSRPRPPCRRCATAPEPG